MRSIFLGYNIVQKYQYRIIQYLLWQSQDNDLPDRLH